MVKLPRLRRPLLRGWPRLPLLGSVRGRIITGFGLLVLILIAGVGGSVWQFHSHRGVTAETREHLATASLMQETRSEVTLASLLVERYIITGSEMFVPSIRSSMATAQDSLAEALAQEQARTDEDEIAALKEIMAGVAFLSESFEQAIAMRQSGDAEGARAIREAASPRRHQIGLAINTATEFKLSEVAALRSRANSTADLAFAFLIASGVVGTALGLAAAFFIARSILKPLTALESAALAVAGGDLEARAAATGPRELAHLGASLNRMTESLLDASKRRELEAERERAYAQLRETEAKFRTLVEQIPVVTYIDEFDETISHNYKIMYLSPQVEAILGYRPDELQADPELWSKLRHPDDRERALAANDRHHATGQPFNLEYRMLARDGRIVWIHDDAVIVRDEAGQPLFSQGVLYDITERKRAEEEMRRLNEQLEEEHSQIEELNLSLEDKVRQRTEELRRANEELRERNRQLMDARAQAATDGLTGLWNHRAFQERVRQEVTQAQENGDSLGLIMLDIDVFKGVNDTLGHQRGDQILQEVAAVVTEAVDGKHAYRYGGDEFAVLLPGTDRRKTGRIAERLRREVAKRTDGNGTKVTISLGVASLPDVATSADELIYGADAAMYWAKSAGKNRVGDWSDLAGDRADGALPWYAADRGVKAPDVVGALVAALDAKDPITSAHTDRCSWYAAKLAQEMGLAEGETSVVRLASLLHDIGKLGVPDEVLFKPGPLNEEEWAQMKQHPTAALHVLGHVRAITDATPAILHHHEHFDGSGYPDGLTGDDIPIASRILLVTDAFDAMTTDRPYRKAMPVEAAIEELKRNSGSQFDPDIVEAFLRILSRDGAQPLRRTARAPSEPVTAEQA